MALAHAIGRSNRTALEASLSAGSPHSRIYWEMERVIFDESAADWLIAPQSSNDAGRTKRARRRRTRQPWRESVRSNGAGRASKCLPIEEVLATWSPQWIRINQQ